MHRIISACFAASVVLAAAPEPVPAPASVRPVVPRVVQQVPPDLAEAILGREVAGPDGKEVGRLVDVLIDAEGIPQAAVLDFGGFMGVGNRRIAVRWDTLHFAPSDPHRAIALDMTPDEIKAAPAYNDPTKPAQVVTPEPAIRPEASTAAPIAGGSEESPSTAAPPAPASATAEPPATAPSTPATAPPTAPPVAAPSTPAAAVPSLPAASSPSTAAPPAIPAPSAAMPPLAPFGAPAAPVPPTAPATATPSATTSGSAPAAAASSSATSTTPQAPSAGSGTTAPPPPTSPQR